MNASRLARRLSAVLAGIVLTVGCTPRPREALTITSSSDIIEGQPAQIVVMVKNVLPEPIIAVSTAIYVQRPPAEYLMAPHALAEVDYMKPLEAADVRHLSTLNRIEAIQVKEGSTWRKMPDSRFLHPNRILLPGESFTETFEFQASLAFRRLLFCNFRYLRLDSPLVEGRLYARATPKTVPQDADRYADLYSLVDAESLTSIDLTPDHYLLFSPRTQGPESADVIRMQVPLHIRPRPFSYQDAATRARAGATDYCYFTAAGTWVFDYGAEGTWFVSPLSISKLTGTYVKMIAELERTRAKDITLTAPRRPGDKLLELLQKAGYSDPQATDPTATATIPLDRLLPTLEQAESLGYIINGITWLPKP